MARILQTLVPPLLPPQGPIRVFLFGEAPGPRGADQSGIPFWGDRSGGSVYRALEAAGLATVPPEAYDTWDGASLKAKGLEPLLHGAALSNAYPRCPTRDFQSFRTPTDRELRDPGNLERLHRELTLAASRCAGTLRVVAMGRRAQWVLERVEGAPPFDLRQIGHPSPLGLLHGAKGRGPGVKMADLRKEWEDRLLALLIPQ